MNNLFYIKEKSKELFKRFHIWHYKFDFIFFIINIFIITNELLQ